MKKSSRLFLIISILVLFIFSGFLVVAQTEYFGDADNTAIENNGIPSPEKDKEVVDGERESNLFTSSFNWIKEKINSTRNKAYETSRELVGVRTGWNFLLSFFWFFLQGLIAGVILLFINYFFINLILLNTVERPFIVNILNKKPLISIVLIGILNAALMSIPLINRVIETITLQIFAFPLGPFSEFFIRTLLLTIFLVIIIFSPAIYLALRDMRERAKTIKAIHDAAAGVAIMREAGRIRRGGP